MLVYKFKQKERCLEEERREEEKRHEEPEAGAEQTLEEEAAAKQKQEEGGKHFPPGLPSSTISEPLKEEVAVAKKGEASSRKVSVVTLAKRNKDVEEEIICVNGIPQFEIVMHGVSLHLHSCLSVSRKNRLLKESQDVAKRV